MIGRVLDNVIGQLFPKWGAERSFFRLQQTKIVKAQGGFHDSMRQMYSRGIGGYEAGKVDRVRGVYFGSAHENDVPRAQIAIMRWRAWNLHRNNPQARKITRNLGAKVIGRNPCPQSHATKKDGTPFTDFSKRARQIFTEFSKECDFRGKPGAGGQSLVQQAKTALRATLLSGGTLYQFHPLTRTEADKLGLLVPLQIQLVHVDRLNPLKHNGTNLFYGLELDNDAKVIRYHILKGGITSNSIKSSAVESVPIDADRMRYLFAGEDIDQLMGSPWVGAAMVTMDDRRNYEFSELLAAEMASCVVMGYRRSNGQTGGLGLNGPDGNRDLTDADGNPITRMQPGMILDLGATGEIDSVNPARPNANAGEFINHLVRSEAVSMPGMKASTLTGDYRNSSFSSERSADNDVWPEIEEIQDWFALDFFQPIYEECIKAAVVDGQFDDIEGFNKTDFAARQRQYLSATWQGPVPRSINPHDDAEASRMRVKNGNSTPQIESQMLGRDIDQILDGIQEFIGKCEEREIPEDIWQQMLGLDQKPTTNPIPDAGGAKPAPDKADQAETDAAEKDGKISTEEATFRRRVASGFQAMNCV